MRQLFLFFLFFSSVLSAQIGIGTDNPQGVFHVDGQRDNPSDSPPSAAEASNDVVVNSQGNVGVGLINPDHKLTINSGEDHVSGLRFTQLSNASPRHSGKAVVLGTNNQGNVIPISNNNCIPDYYSGRAAEERLEITGNTVLNTFTERVVSNGISQTANGFLLKAGKLYRLEAALYSASNSTSARNIIYEWHAGGNRIPNQNYILSANSASNGGNQPYALAYIKPTSDTYVTLVGVSRSHNNVGYWGSHSYILIEQLSPCSK